ncbi:MAG: efflux RND transporter periplasmic adaptor subunit [Pedobacter sp.]|nr:efflux RND transporter periplasmic adaptor subunit [Pedobacter sp.]
MNYTMFLLFFGVFFSGSLSAVEVVKPVAKPQMTPSQMKAAPVAASKSDTTRFITKSPQEAQLASQMSGRLLRFLVQDGATFRKGDKLAEFDCAERQAQMDRARASNDKAEKTEVSQKQLRSMKAISDLDYEIAAASLREAKADVAIAQAQVSQCFIQAPYAGRVVRRIANQYENMTVGTPVIQIVESGPLRLDLLVPSSWLRWLKKGSVFSIHVDELGVTYQATITSIGARVDAASQTIDVRAGISGQAPGMLPGMSGTADFGVH